MRAIRERCNNALDARVECTTARTGSEALIPDPYGTLCMMLSQTS